MRMSQGKFAGVRLRPHQYANDWISFDAEGGGHGIANPARVQLDPDDFPLFDSRDPGHPEHHSCGSFWQEWRLNDDGTFTSLQAVDPRHTRRRP